MMRVEIQGISFTLKEEDKILEEEENNGKKIQLFSQEVMALDKATGEEVNRFYPVIVRSCMDRSILRKEPVTVKELPENGVEISMLGTTERYDMQNIRILCREWSPEAPRKGCGDCSRCRKCWA